MSGTYTDKDLLGTPTKVGVATPRVTYYVLRRCELCGFITEEKYTGVRNISAVEFSTHEHECNDVHLLRAGRPIGLAKYIEYVIDTTSEGN